MRRIYLDNNATSKIHEEVFNEMLPFLKEEFGNPSSLHGYGRTAAQALKLARERLATFINAEPNEITFTSGGTESDNLAIKGIAWANENKGKHIITSKIEHPAVLQTCRYLEKKGFQVTYLPTDKNGIVDIKALEQAINPNTILISIMYANNEVGTIQAIKEICKIAKKHKILVHTDAVQAAGKIPIDVKDLNIDLLSLSGHKINGPKGVGALYIKKGIRIEALFHGGHQEKNKRTGTENLASIIGLGKACEIMKRNEKENYKIAQLRDNFEKKLSKAINYITINAQYAQRTPNTSNICFHFTEGESIMLNLDMAGIAVSTGSACASGSLEPSYVLAAMNVPVEIAQGAIRFSLSHETTETELDKTIEELKKIVQKVREMSPLYEDMLEKQKLEEK